MFFFEADVILNIVKVIVAVLCAMLIGLQGSEDNRAARIQSLVLVAIGSSFLMIVAIYLSPHIISQPTTIAVNIMIGILILGMIILIKEKATMKGIANAAAVWVTAGISLAVGVGLFLEAIFVTFIILVIFQLFPKQTQ